MKLVLIALQRMVPALAKNWQSGQDISLVEKGMIKVAPTEEKTKENRRHKKCKTDILPLF